MCRIGQAAKQIARTIGVRKVQAEKLLLPKRLRARITRGNAHVGVAGLGRWGLNDGSALVAQERADGGIVCTRLIKHARHEQVLGE